MKVVFTIHQLVLFRIQWTTEAIMVLPGGFFYLQFSPTKGLFTELAVSRFGQLTDVTTVISDQFESHIDGQRMMPSEAFSAAKKA